MHFDLQLFAEPELPPIGANGTTEKHLEPLSDDFDAVLSAEQSAARERPVESFVAARHADDADDKVPTVDATSTEDLQAAAVAAKRDDAPAVDTALEEPIATDDVTRAPAKPVVAEKPVAEPVAEKPTADVPAPAASIAPAGAPTFAPDEVVAIAADQSMTRGELKQRLDFLNVAMTEANSFRDIFGVTAEQATAVWKPVIDGIRQDPSRAEFFDKMAEVVADPAQRAYVEKAVAFFEAERAKGNPEAAAAPAAAKPAEPFKDPRVDQMLAQQQRAQMEATRIAVDSEKRAMITEFPQLADSDLMQWVAIKALNRINGDPQRGVPGDPTYTLTRAMRDNLTHIQRFGGAPAPLAAAPAAKPVPALNGSGGAAPGGSRRADTTPKSYSTPDDALDAWVAEHPDDYRA